MSEVRLGVTGLLVPAVFRNRQIRQAQMQGLQWKGDNHILPECSLAHAEAFSNLDELRPSSSLKARRCGGGRDRASAGRCSGVCTQVDARHPAR
jgi:hypothetical protein